ncbi:MAG: 6-bladed beta-propeller [Candidatus Aminicenantes bacterium]|nr:6-bladed beta-propeller [Candidatus Aminicenantes bacterium]
MSSRFNLIVLFIFLVTMVSSCSQNGTEWQGTIEEVDGVTYVKNPEEGLWDIKEEANVTMIKERQIGELDGPEEFLFVYITDVAVNSKGDFYVADRQLNEVRKFNKDGEYLLTVGRFGQGPGEFQSVQIVCVNNHNELIVFDARSGRISVFSDKWELIKTTKKLLENSWISPTKIFDIENSYVIFGQLNNSLKMFHEFSKDWKIEDSYIDYEFIDNREFEEQSLGFNSGNCEFSNNGDMFYTKYYYDNQIFVYRNRELTKIISRESNIRKPYEVQVYSDVKKAMEINRANKEYDIGSFGRGIAFLGKLYQTSLGIYKLADGHIVNFLRIRKSKDIKEFGVELYDSSGKFLVYSKLGENLWYDIRCKDANDLFYAIERKDYNKVIMFRLEY